MGFGLKLEDLSRNKLKKVDKGGEQKPMQMVQPMDHAKEPEKVGDLSVCGYFF